MAQLLDLKNGNTKDVEASTTHMEKSIEHDAFLAAISVIPASILWVLTEHLVLALMLGTSIFLAAEYGYPALKSGKIDLEPMLRLIAATRDTIRTRVARRA